MVASWLLADGQAQPASRSMSDGRDDFPRPTCIGNDPPGVQQKHPLGFGETHAGAFALEQGDAKLVFKRCDLTGNHRLTDAHQCSRTAKA